MKNIGIAIRSLFKRGQHNVMKIISLGIGLTIGLVLIAKVHFENTYDNFYPNVLPGKLPFYDVRQQASAQSDLHPSGQLSFRRIAPPHAHRRP